MLKQQGVEVGGPPAVGVGALLGIVAPLLQHMLVEGRAAEGHGHELKVPLMTFLPCQEECVFFCKTGTYGTCFTPWPAICNRFCITITQTCLLCDASASFCIPCNPKYFL